MRETSESRSNAGRLSRRSAFKAAAAAGAAGLIGGGIFTAASFADSLTKEERDTLSPDDILAMIKQYFHDCS